MLPDDNGKYWIPKGYKVKVSADSKDGYEINGGTGNYTINAIQTANITTKIISGATATPTNNVQIWLHCAEILDKNYTTLNQVLTDQTTLLKLISSKNACDYLVRSTSWVNTITGNQQGMTTIGENDYCADTLLANSTWKNAICDSTYFESVLNAKIPVMTSYTSPSGECYATSEYTKVGELAWKAFDENISTHWNSMTNTGQYCWYKFPKAVKPYKIAVNQGANATAWQKCKIQGSNDNSHYVDLTDEILDNTDAHNTDIVKSLNNDAYLYFRAYCTDTNYTSVAICLLQIYGRYA